MSTSRDGTRAKVVTADARRAGRRRALLNGKIVAWDGMQSVSCVVRDISQSGARIALPHSTVVPARFFLICSRQPSAWDARIVWRNATQAGLAFGDERRLSPDMDAELKFLWQLYLELGGRATNPFEF